MIACMDAGNSEAPVVALYVLPHTDVWLHVGRGSAVVVVVWCGILSLVLCLSVCMCVCSASKGMDVHTPVSGRKGVEGLRSSYGTWLARKGHMTRSSQATFHGHHFKAIMGFILDGYAPR